MIKNYYLRLIISSALAGIIMAFAGFELIAFGAGGDVAKIIGSFVQGFGLLLVTFFGLDLYNSHINDIFTEKNKLKFILHQIIRLVINIGFVVLFSYIFFLASGSDQRYVEVANQYADYRTLKFFAEDVGRFWYEVLFSSIACGMITATASFVYKKVNSHVAHVLIMFIAVGVYVICGFENLMTNISYATFAHDWRPGSIADLGFVLFGNTIGAMLIYLITQFIGKNLTPLYNKKSESDKNYDEKK